MSSIADTHSDKLYGKRFTFQGEYVNIVRKSQYSKEYGMLLNNVTADGEKLPFMAWCPDKFYASKIAPGIGDIIQFDGQLRKKFKLAKGGTEYDTGIIFYATNFSIVKKSTRQYVPDCSKLGQNVQ